MLGIGPSNPLCILKFAFSNYSGWVPGWPVGNTLKLKPASNAELGNIYVFVKKKPHEKPVSGIGINPH